MAQWKENGKLKLMIIVGTRPEIIRLAAVIKKCRKYFNTILVHTGQNYDYNLNGVFFKDLGLDDPELYLDAVGNDLGETKKLHGDGLSIEDIAKELNIKEKLVVDCLNFTFHYEQLMVSYDDDPDEDQNPRIAPISDNVRKKAIQRAVYPLLRQKYAKLKAEQQHILGCYLGIFGYEKMSVADIADMLMITRNAAQKKIAKALEKLYEYVWDSEIKYWINGYLCLFR